MNGKGKLFAVAVLALVSALGVSAQDVPAAPVQHFVISASASAFNGQSGASAATIAGAGIQLTKNVSVGYNQIYNPADSNAPKYRLGVVNYTRELSAILGKSLSSKLQFDSTNFLVTFQGGAGKVNFANVNRVAETGGVFLSRPLADHLSVQIMGYQILHGQGTSILTRNVTQQVSTGLNITF